jgi:hypothetical protein
MAACTFGPRLETVSVAHRPEGAMVHVTTQGVHGGEEDAVPLSGELLEAREEGLLLRTAPGREESGGPLPPAPRIVLVRYRTTPGEVRFGRLHPRLLPGHAPKAQELARLRLLSRFPQGLRPELLEALLRGCGQQEVEVWRR